MIWGDLPKHLIQWKECVSLEKGRKSSREIRQRSPQHLRPADAVFVKYCLRGMLKGVGGLCSPQLASWSLHYPVAKILDGRGSTGLYVLFYIP